MYDMTAANENAFALPVEIDPAIDERLRRLEKLLDADLPQRLRRAEETIVPLRVRTDEALAAAHAAAEFATRTAATSRRRRILPIAVRNLTALGGLASLGYGLWLISPAAAFSVLGGCLWLLVVLGTLNAKTKEGQT